MKRSTAWCGAFAILVALPMLPLGGIVVNGPPAMVFFMGATAFICGVVLLVWLLAWAPRQNNISAHISRGSRGARPSLRDGARATLTRSPQVRQRFRFAIRDLVCLTTVVFGFTIFMVSAFRCEAAERASRPGPLPAVLYRQFAWELEAGLVCMTIGGLMWIRPALDAATREGVKMRVWNQTDAQD